MLQRRSEPGASGGTAGQPPRPLDGGKAAPSAPGIRITPQSSSHSGIGVFAMNASIPRSVSRASMFSAIAAPV